VRHAPACGIAAIKADDVQRQHHIVEHRAVKQQLVILKYHADMLTDIGNLAVAQLGQICPLTITLPLVARSMPATSLSKVDLPAPE
jgi:hypothetical protein